MTAGDLLNVETVVGYLEGRGFDIARSTATVSALSGGVSNVVLRVDHAGGAMVVKQALGKLAVSDDWFADRGRAQHEAAAIGVLQGLTPSSVPALFDDDPEQFALTISAAPTSWTTWKQDLMTGVVDTGVAHRLGQLLALWQRGTTGVTLPECLETSRSLKELRTQPYFDVAARRAPDLEPALSAVTDLVSSTAQCLVLGDFSPKNILVGSDADQLWAIDHEVAHRGHPGFDVAFMATHLTLKAVRSAPDRHSLFAALEAFLEGYGGGGAESVPGEVGRIVGALLAARVLGASPVDYLDAEQQAGVLALARRMLTIEGAAQGWKDEVTSWRS